jgi:hypothetical protein
MRSCKIQLLMVLCGDPGYRKYACAFHPAGRRPSPKVLALQSLGEPLEEALSVKPGMRAVGGMLVVYGKKTAESQSARRTNGRRRLLSQMQSFAYFMNLMVENRRHELAVFLATCPSSGAEFAKVYFLIGYYFRISYSEFDIPEIIRDHEESTALAFFISPAIASFPFKRPHHSKQS